jgi:predicted PurR-regulated permease PerM
MPKRFKNLMKANYLLIFLTIAFLYLIHPFFSTIFSSILLAYITLPLFKKINHYLKSKRVSAAISSFIAILAFFLLYYAFFKLASFSINGINQVLMQIKLLPFIPESNSFIFSEEYEGSIFSQNLKQILDLILLSFLIFYLLYESDDFFAKANKNLNRAELKKIKKFKEILDLMLESVFLKYFIKSIIMGLAVFFSFSILNIPYAFEIAILCAIAAMLPFFNSGLIVLAVSIYYLFIGNYFIFMIILIESLLFILIHYNFDRMFKIKKEINPFAFIVGAIIGSASLGIFGFIAGPVLAGAIQAAYQSLTEQ